MNTTFPNKRTYGYDSHGRLASVRQSLDGGSDVTLWTGTYNAIGQLATAVTGAFLYKVNLAWEPIVSVTGTISMLVSFPLHCYIGIIYLRWAKQDIPTTVDFLLLLLNFGAFYWLTTLYYRSIEIPIERRFKKDNIYRKVVFGIIAIALSGISIYISSIMLEIHVETYRHINRLNIPF